MATTDTIAPPPSGFVLDDQSETPSPPTPPKGFILDATNIPAAAPGLSKVKPSPTEDVFLKTGLKDPGMQPGTDFLQSIAKDPVGFVKSIPGAAGTMMGEVGKIPYQAWQLGVNAALGQSDADAADVTDKYLADLSRSNPVLGVAAKLSKGTAEMAPMLGIGALPEAAQTLIARGFTADMLYHAPGTAKELYAEYQKPANERDPDKISILISDGLQQVGFGALGLAHEVPGAVKDFTDKTSVRAYLADKYAPKTTGPVESPLLKPEAQAAVPTAPPEQAGQTIQPIPPEKVTPGFASKTAQNVRPPRVAVPETAPEEEKGINVLEEIRQHGAKTIAEIQRIFPQAQLNREAARKLRDDAWGKQAQPTPTTQPISQPEVEAAKNEPAGLPRPNADVPASVANVGEAAPPVQSTPTPEPPISEASKPAATPTAESVPQKGAGVDPDLKKAGIVHEDADGNYITKEKNGNFKVWQRGPTASKLVGTIGFKGEKGLTKAKERLAKLSAPARETVTPSEDTPIGQNSAGEKLYQRKDGSVYRMQGGKPNFGGDLAQIETPSEPAPTPNLPEPATKPAVEKAEAPKAQKAQPIPQGPGANQKYRVASQGPQLHVLVEKLHATPVEIANGEQPVRVRNEKTGAEFTTLEKDLTPVKEATEPKPKVEKESLDDQLRSVGLDPSVFPDAKSKQAALKRQDAIKPRFGKGGPGAAAGGEPGTYSAIQQMSDNLRATAGADKPLDEQVSAIQKAKDKLADIKDYFKKSAATVKAVADALWNRYRSVPEFGDEKRAVGKWFAAVQQADHEARQFAKQIIKEVPNKLRREAITNWIQADGDTALLKEREAASRGSLKRGYQIAQNLTDREKYIAQTIREYYDRQLENGIEAGLLKDGLEQYITQVWKKENPITKKLLSDLSFGKLTPNFRFARKRIFDSYFEGEQAGYTPQKDAGFLVANYDQTFNRALAARAFIKDLHEAKASDGRPLVELSGSGRKLEGESGEGGTRLIRPHAKPEELKDYQPINHPALRGWKFAGTEPDGTTILHEGDMLVHPEAYNKLLNRLSVSKIRKNPAGRALLRLQGDIKRI